MPAHERTLGISAYVASFVIILLALSAATFAQTLTGIVSNGTTNKPSAGDEVILIKLAQGMEEAARTKSDSKGAFHFDAPDAGAPHLIRVIHQGVTYHRPAPPGTTSVEVQVFDAAKKIEGVSATADLLYVQAKPDELGITRIFAVNNISKPPQTQMNDHNFEFYLPEGAQIDGAQAQTAGGQWVNSDPVAEAEKGRYAFNFPLRPGQTDFQITYRIPYTGTAKVDPRPLYPLEHLVVILPQSIQFSAAQEGTYDNKQPPNQPGAIAEVAVNTHVGQALSFTVTGTGVLQEDTSASDSPTGEAPAGAAKPRDNRPGGGLGPPSDAPDPLEKYRWYILGGFAVALIAGAVYIATRSKTISSTSFASNTELTGPPVKSTLAAHSGMLLEALKEEIFQLEVEHKQGSITQEEYEKAKAALDQTLERAVKRGAVKAT